MEQKIAILYIDPDHNFGVSFQTVSTRSFKQTIETHVDGQAVEVERKNDVHCGWRAFVNASPREKGLQVNFTATRILSYFGFRMNLLTTARGNVVLTSEEGCDFTPQMRKELEECVERENNIKIG